MPLEEQCTIESFRKGLTKAGAEMQEREGGKERGGGLPKIYQKAKERKLKDRRVRQLESHWKPLINKAQCWLQ